ncbi:MAG: hypothetical protein JWN50_172 [Parcubacteria group bacterium]|nr:hypothetical protein [Parcubacteria group bacterium]
MRERILFDIFLFFLVLYAPYWIYLPALILGIILFPLFWESVLFSLFIDYFYGPHTHSGSIFAFPFAIVASLFTLALIPIKESLRLHA